MAGKINIPGNNLGSFLTQKGISNIDLHAETSIPTNDLSHLRNGKVKSIQGEKLFLIAKSSKIPLKEMLQNVYPNLKLKDIPNEKTKVAFETMKDFFKYLDIVDALAKKTGLTPYRVKNIKNNNVSPDAHELYLIELASKIEPGTLFNTFYRHIELNSPEEQERLRALERERSKKK